LFSFKVIAVLDEKDLASEYLRNYHLLDDPVVNKAKYLATLIAAVIFLWSLAVTPEIRRGTIFPRSFKYFCRRGTFL